MFFWAVEEGLVSGAVCYSLQEVKAPRKHRSDAREKPEVGPVADEHVKAVVPYVSEVVADVIRVMRLSGMRPGEACAMMVEQIDRTDPECWRYVPGAHKTQHRGKPRVIFLGPKCQQILTRRISKAGTGRVFPISRSSVRTAIIRGCRRASVPNWSPNQLRHAAATEIRAKYGIEGAAGDSRSFPGDHKSDLRRGQRRAWPRDRQVGWVILGTIDPGRVGLAGRSLKPSGPVGVGGSLSPLRRRLGPRRAEGKKWPAWSLYTASSHRLRRSILSSAIHSRGFLPRPCTRCCGWGRYGRRAGWG